MGHHSKSKSKKEQNAASGSSEQQVAQSQPQSQPEYPSQQYYQPPPANEHRSPSSPSPCGKNNPCCCELQCGVLGASICGIAWYFMEMIFAGVFLAIGFAVFGYHSSYSIIFFIQLADAIIGLTFAILLTIGAALKSSLMVKIAFGGYLLVFLLDFAFLVLTLLILIEGNNLYPKLYPIWYVVCSSLLMIIYMAIFVYVLFVIFSYIRQLTRAGQQVDAASYGQFPAGPPRPQQSTYQPTHPNSGY